MRHSSGESPAKVEENGCEPPTTIDTFRRVTKGLLAVKPEELAEKERAYQKARKLNRS
jgi:hypothetical protein